MIAYSFPLRQRFSQLKLLVALSVSYQAGHESSWGSFVIKVEYKISLCKSLCHLKIHTSERYKLESDYFYYQKMYHSAQVLIIVP